MEKIVMDKTENYWKILGDVNDSIKFAEAKAIALISTSGILIAFLFSRPDIINIIKDSTSSLIIFIICSSAFLLSIISAVICLKPNFKYKSSKSIIFFKTISKDYSSGKDYFIASQKILTNEKDLGEQLSEQIIIKSRIVNGKFRAIQMSIYFFIIFIILIMILMIIKSI